MPTTIKDVALRAGVSSATVSRVLTGKTHVREAVRQRVLTAVQELGYKPSRVARSLRVRRSQIIGLIISDIQSQFFTALVRAVEDTAQQAGYAVILCNSDENITKEALYIDLMLEEQVSGVLITPTREYDNPSRRLVEAGIPVVAVDRYMLDIDVDTVVVDNIGSAFNLVNHMILAGHHRIGAILAESSITTGRERLAGYRKALEAHHLPSDPALIKTGVPRRELGYLGALQLLGLDDPPTALFCGNNLLTIGAFEAINERHMKIPDDIAIASFDGLICNPLSEPALTIIEQPVYELGKVAAELLMQRIQGSKRPHQKIELKTRLCIHSSSGYPRIRANAHSE
jgi:DNA-binding LacI/PurR family transcriptional regulator